MDLVGQSSIFPPYLEEHHQPLMLSGKLTWILPGRGWMTGFLLGYPAGRIHVSFLEGKYCIEKVAGDIKINYT